MAHEIMTDDQMVSVREVPWHGLGIILEDYPTVWEAAAAANLEWAAELVPVVYKGQEVVGKQIVVRNDLDKPIGVVGNGYTPFQNMEMWEFLDKFVERSGATLETAGSLRNGARVWALLNAGEVEYLSGDPIQRYFLCRNSFDGSSAINLLFSDVRVVCANTLRMAIKGAGAIYGIRHTKNVALYLEQADKALAFRFKRDEAVQAAMGKLIAFPLNPKVALEEMYPVADVAGQDRAMALRDEKLQAILELTESGAGVEIPGVRGTAYGLYQAIVEYADHVKPARLRDKALANVREAKFNRLMLEDMSTANLEKEAAFDWLLKKAA